MRGGGGTLILKMMSVPAISIALSVLRTCASADGQHADAESWFRAQWEAAKKPRLSLLTPYTMYQWEVAWGDPPSAQRVAELRQEVKGKPDHPARAELEMQERLLARGGKPATVSYQLWWVSEREWRLNTSTNSLPEPDYFADYAALPNARWLLTPAQLTLTNLDDTPRANDLGSTIESSISDLVLLLWQGFASNRHIPNEVVEFSLEGDAWTARTSCERGLWEHAGTWLADLHVGLVHRVTATPATTESWSPMVFQFADHDVGSTHQAALPRTMTAALLRGSQSRSERTALLGALASFDPNEIVRLTALPRPGGEDAIRGPVRVSRIHDHRSGDWVEAEVSGDQVVRESTLTTVRADRAWWRTLGIATLCVLCAILIYLRFKHRS